MDVSATSAIAPPLVAPGPAGMSTIPWLEDFYTLSGVEKTFLVLSVFIIAFATGFVIDVIMRNLAFGPALNGVLAVAGVFGGIYLRYRLLAPYRADDLFLTMGSALGGAFFLFVALGFIKSRL
jgi:hypothetical protein